MKKILLLLFLLMSPLSFVSAQESNVGIIQGIWFSEEPFFDGDTVRIYTAIQNNSGHDVRGVIDFFDNGELIGSKSFSALNQRIIESWVDTTVDSGKHEFNVRIKEVIQDKPGQEGVPVDSISLASKKELYVLIDTDSDNIPDVDDEDDDNDGFTDEQEHEAGTDPLSDFEFPDEEIVEDISENTANNIAADVEEFLNIPEEEKEILEDLVPKAVMNVVEDNTFLENLVLQISRLQKNSQDEIKKQQGKQKAKNSHTVNLSPEGDRELQQQVEEIASSKFAEKILSVLHNIVSIWWVFPILIILAVWIILKLLFRIGRSFVRKKS